MPRDPDRAFFGHPVGLRTLFFTEMWERFSYYGMRAFLAIYMTREFAVGGLGMTKEGAGVVMALYLSSVYLLSLPGGWIADRFIGQRKAVMVGGIGIALGNAVLAMPIDGLFYPGLCIVALGTGLLKPNVSTIVGQLYRADDARRDSGFTIYYMGINIGATLSPFVCGYLAQEPSFREFLASNGIDPKLCWNFAFGASAIAMVAGLIQYSLAQKVLGEAGLNPTIPTDARRAGRDRSILTAIIVGLLAVIGFAVAVQLTGFIQPSGDQIANVFGVCLVIASVLVFYGLLKAARDADERKRMIAMIPLYIGAVAFFAIFEQASSTLSIFAEELTSREFLGLNIPASYYQSVNGFFIVLLAPAFAWMWLRLIRKKKEPTSVAKFGIGMVILALSFVLMLPAKDATPDAPASAGYLIGLYFLYTAAELCISPVGLSSMSKLAPARLAGMVMGVWFMAAAVGNYLAGRAAGFADKRGYAFLFVFLIVCSLVTAVALFLVAPAIKRMMGRDAHASGPADKSEKAEPEALPTARVVNDD